MENFWNSVLQTDHLLKIAIGATGAVVGWLLTKVSNKLATVTFQVQTNRLGQTANNDVHGRIEVHHRGVVLDNFYFSNVLIRNASNTDLENVTIMFFVDQNALIISDFIRHDAAASAIPYSAAYGEIVSDPQHPEFFKQREYTIPVLNRGKKVHLELTLTHNSSINFPLVFASMNHKGAKLIEQRNVAEIHGVPLTRTLPWAVILGVLLYPVICLLVSNSWVIGGLMLVYGFFAQSCSAFLIKAVDWISEKLGIIPPNR